MKLTVAQQDYLEVIHGLSTEESGVRTTDIAERLSCRLPTVTRTVRKMSELGLVEHESRGLVSLTRKGQSAARDLAHRHADTAAFLREILGLTATQAEHDACQIEHGLSPLAAQRLHEFLEYFEQLGDSQRAVVTAFARNASNTPSDFRNLPNGKTAGWRV
jgi:DtxR family Mn-dependent transcriptional regulator